MLLEQAQVTFYKSIDDSGEVGVEKDVTVMVGQNESGKTAFLQALHKSMPVEPGISFDVTQDYPRKGLNDYEAIQDKNPASVVRLTFVLTSDEVTAVNNDLGASIVDHLSFVYEHKYGGGTAVTMALPEEKYVKHLLSLAKLASETAKAVDKAQSVRVLIAELETADLNTEEQTFLDGVKSRFANVPADWGMLNYLVWANHLKPSLPKFLYFDDYYLLPGKVNLQDLQRRYETSAQSPKAITNEDRTVLSLLRMAGVDLDALTDPAGYERIKAKLEAFSNSVTDKVFEYWTQNQELEVEFDIRSDSQDLAPFNSGNNLYIRIRNRRHRVTVPFSQRSKGFIWFFSFLVWFSSIRQQLQTDRDVILLLDEPGLSLHALAQADFLRYIDDLARRHQIIYSTHSPFMINGDRLHQVRTVEDRPKVGTKVSANVSGADAKTIFPLQAALGYTIAQNLFISRKNLLVEGPGDLVYLRYFSSMLEGLGRTALREDITIVPVGGLDKIATFVALLKGNDLQLVVMHDFEGKPDIRLESLVRDKLIRDKHVLHYGLFRNAKSGAASSTGVQSSDVEDMVSPTPYLKIFNAAFADKLGGAEIKESDLPEGERMVERITRHLKDREIQLRPSGGYNHYLVANHLAANPVRSSKVDAATLNRFEKLFAAVNELLST